MIGLLNLEWFFPFFLSVATLDDLSPTPVSVSLALFLCHLHPFLATSQRAMVCRIWSAFFFFSNRLSSLTMRVVGPLQCP